MKWPCIFLLLLSFTALGSPGKFDYSFGIGGVVRNMIGPIGASGRSIAVQQDGKIIVAGVTGSDPFRPEQHAVLVRLNSDGTIDSSFRNNFESNFALDAPNYAWDAVRVQPDGKIVVIGTISIAEGGAVRVSFIMIRRNADGSPDTSFGSNGYVETYPGGGTYPYDVPFDLDFQANGKIVVVGGSNDRMFVVRYKQNGSLDTSFGVSGIVVNKTAWTAESVRIQDDQKIVVTGRSGTFRFKDDGLLDTNFGNGGMVYDPRLSDGQALAIRPDGRLVAGGTASNPSGFALVQYLANGEVDTSFGANGLAYVPDISGSNNIALQGNGKIVAAGDRRIVRFNSNGSLDRQFGSGGLVPAFHGVGYVRDVALQPDGEIVTTGDIQVGFYPDLLVGRNLAYDTAFDYGIDGKSDVSVFRPSDNNWYIQEPTGGLFAQNFGLFGDKITPADYDGDGKTDIAVYRPSTGIWYVFNSFKGTVSYYQFGLAEDLPTPADYDGDGKADISVFRPSTGTWYRQNSENGSFFGVQFGVSEDKPIVGDFDGDGKADIAVWRPSTGAWYWINSLNGISGFQFGISTDVIVPADYDGDGKTDIAVFRPSNGVWYLTSSLNGAFSYSVFGLANDIPVPGDFDGDGKADICVFRPSDGTWYRQNSSNDAFIAFQFGTNGDKPTQAAFRY